MKLWALQMDNHIFYTSSYMVKRRTSFVISKQWRESKTDSYFYYQWVAKNNLKVFYHTHRTEKTEQISLKNWTCPTICTARWELVGQSSSSLSFPLTSAFLSTYLCPPRSMQALISTSCALAQGNNLPEATWQAMNSPSPPSASCSPLICERCTGVPAAGLSIATLFPTSHASFPLPQVTVIGRC